MVPQRPRLSLMKPYHLPAVGCCGQLGMSKPLCLVAHDARSKLEAITKLEQFTNKLFQGSLHLISIDFVGIAVPGFERH